MTETTGYVAASFEPVRQAFEANFKNGEELGASFAAILDGQAVVDIRGGWADRRQTVKWTETTIAPVFSTTKGVAAIVVALILDRSDGAIRYETPVAEVWPEFASAGKADITIGQVVSHQAGLSGFIEEIDPSLWLDPPACAAAIAGLPPLWPPGSAHGYHPLTWGYLVGEITKRIDGRTLGAILREDICQPAGLDFQIGLPEADHERCADIQRPRALPDLGDLNEATRAAFLTRWAAPNRGGAAWREIEIPSANGHGAALAIATLYGVYANEGQLSGRDLLSPSAYEALTATQTIGKDLVLPFVTEFAAGVMRNNLGLYGPNPDTLAHSGWGGSMALGDPAQGLSAAYVMNKQSHHLQGDPRARRLIDALYSCL